jgi:hypothetical protein
MPLCSVMSCPETPACHALLGEAPTHVWANQLPLILPQHSNFIRLALLIPVLEELLTDLHACLSLLLALHCDAHNVCTCICALLDLQCTEVSYNDALCCVYGCMQPHARCPGGSLPSCL